jgi:hypothetical protein
MPRPFTSEGHQVLLGTRLALEAGEAAAEQAMARAAVRRATPDEKVLFRAVKIWQPNFRYSPATTNNIRGRSLGIWGFSFTVAPVARPTCAPCLLRGPRRPACSHPRAAH